MAADRLGHCARGFVGLGFGVHDFENPVAGGAAGLENLVELVQAADGLVKKADEDEEGDERAGFHLSREDERCAEARDEENAERGEEFHARLVDRPGFHDGEGGLADAVAGAVEAGVFAVLAGVGFYLADAGDVVVEEGIEGGDGLALFAVA